MNKLDKYIAEVKDRLEKATKGPWFARRCTDDCWCGVISDVEDSDLLEHCILSSGSMSIEDAAFSAHSRTDVEALIDILNKVIEQRNKNTSSSDSDLMYRAELDSQLESLIPTEGDK